MYYTYVWLLKIQYRWVNEPVRAATEHSRSHPHQEFCKNFIFNHVIYRQEQYKNIQAMNICLVRQCLINLHSRSGHNELNLGFIFRGADYLIDLLERGVLQRPPVPLQHLVSFKFKKP